MHYGPNKKGWMLHHRYVMQQKLAAIIVNSQCPDPLLGLPEQERLLFEAFKKISAGQNVDAVLGAALNIIINSVRQMEPTKAEAEARYDALFGRAKTLLLERHYDSVTGRRRSVFPFTQVVKAAYHEEDDLIRG